MLIEVIWGMFYDLNSHFRIGIQKNKDTQLTVSWNFSEVLEHIVIVL